jgi:hypothetical protein
MFADTITVFNSYEDSLKNVTWYPTVIHGVNLLIDKSAIVAKYGAESKDNAILNIHFDKVNEQIMVDGKNYLPPKEWERQTNDKLADSITFASGTDFDFFMLGEYPMQGPINDDEYRNGFFEEVKKEYDYVFAITSVAKYTVIPHFEITGK